jgi:hypothetical protein
MAGRSHNARIKKKQPKSPKRHGYAVLRPFYARDPPIIHTSPFDTLSAMLTTSTSAGWIYQSVSLVS